LRTLLIAAGLLSLALAALGVLLPLLPTTPFVLLAAGCFSRASPRLHTWLLRLPLAGRMLDEYERHGGLSRRSKRNALVLVWSGVGVSAFSLAGSHALMVLLGTIAAVVSVVIVKLPRSRLEVFPGRVQLAE
jgi:uncharacterized membrane protein YbaN (DUF454 family)